MPDDQGLLPVLRCEDFIVGGGKVIYSLSHPVWDSVSEQMWLQPKSSHKGIQKELQSCLDVEVQK